jgi:hypothetical protein
MTRYASTISKRNLVAVNVKKSSLLSLIFKVWNMQFKWKRDWSAFNHQRQLTSCFNKWRYKIFKTMTIKEMIIIFSRQNSKNKMKETFLKWIKIFQEKCEIRLRTKYNLLKRFLKKWKMRHDAKCEVRLKIKYIELKDSVALWKVRCIKKCFYGIGRL